MKKPSFNIELVQLALKKKGVIFSLLNLCKKQANLKYSKIKTEINL